MNSGYPFEYPIQPCDLTWRSYACKRLDLVLAKDVNMGRVYNMRDIPKSYKIPSPVLKRLHDARRGISRLGNWMYARRVTLGCIFLFDKVVVAFTENTNPAHRENRFEYQLVYAMSKKAWWFERLYSLEREVQKRRELRGRSIDFREFEPISKR